MFTTQFSHRRSGLGLLKDGHDLAFGETLFFHRNLLRSDYDKILLMNTPIFRGNYQSSRHGRSYFQMLNALEDNEGIMHIWLVDKKVMAANDLNSLMPAG
ncbi:hypothetical protein [Serratia fonticola]|uniref:hypothetical protein n=1 Tax=Serratia fonticola TaxID=47917 RepID=UPI0021BDCA9F|nr:hypothetical protein [Serratia fonticola]